jgi:hypothetical protein
MAFNPILGPKAGQTMREVNKLMVKLEELERRHSSAASESERREIDARIWKVEEEIKVAIHHGR